MTRLPEQPDQQVEQVDADVGGDAAGFLDAALPRDLIPGSAARDVDQRHVGTAGGRLRAQPLAEFYQLRMEPQLKDGEHAASRFELQLLQGIEVPGIDDDRLFAERIRAAPQRESNVGVVEVVRTADADPVDVMLGGTAPQLIDVAIEALDLAKVAHVVAVAIEDADRIVRVDSGDETMTGIVDGLEMTARHVARHADDSKVLHSPRLPAFTRPPGRGRYGRSWWIRPASPPAEAHPHRDRGSGARRPTPRDSGGRSPCR